MSLTRWLSERLWLSGSRERASRPASPRKRPTFRPTLEALEHRYLLSTLTVLNTHDSGAGSLRAEIAAAHSNDTIVFAPSLDGQTITLTSGELLIKKNLTIAGPGAGELTVSGNNASRVFEVASKENVTLSGLTISDGAASGVGQAGEGAGILNHGTLTVSGSALSGNSANQNGGGIHNDGTMTVSNSTLSGNSAGEGGGIRNEGTLTVSGSVLSGNVGTVVGGGIENYGTLTVSGSTLSGNSANQNGGGIFNDGTLTVSSSTLSGNSTTQQGGGIYNNGTMTVSNSTLSSNSASYGGGIYDYSGTLTVSGSTLSSNSATYYGGGIYNGAGSLTVSGSTLSGNSAASAGGGIYNTNSVSATVTVKNSSSITGNTAPVGFGADADNLGVLYLDISSMIGILDGNPAVPI
jgi:hypothetical protein